MDADAFFRQDAKARGMTLSDYEREFGVQVTGGPAQERTAYNELPAGVMGDDDVARALHYERNFVRKEKRRRARSYVRRPTATLIPFPARRTLARAS
jgi:hypothetical protein